MANHLELPTANPFEIYKTYAESITVDSMLLHTERVISTLEKYLLGKTLNTDEIVNPSDSFARLLYNEYLKSQKNSSPIEQIKLYVHLNYTDVKLLKGFGVSWVKTPEDLSFFRNQIKTAVREAGYNFESDFTSRGVVFTTDYYGSIPEAVFRQAVIDSLKDKFDYEWVNRYEGSSFFKDLYF